SMRRLNIFVSPPLDVAAFTELNFGIGRGPLSRPAGGFLGRSLPRSFVPTRTYRERYDLTHDQRRRKPGTRPGPRTVREGELLDQVDDLEHRQVEGDDRRAHRGADHRDHERLDERR